MAERLIGLAEPVGASEDGLLRDRLGFDFLVLVTAVDNYMDEPRFEVTYRLRSISRNADVRINVPAGGDPPDLGTVADLYPAANWMEREVWDMFGIRFRGHPNLKRILMYEEFEGHALRKDYPADLRWRLVRPDDLVNEISPEEMARVRTGAKRAFSD